MRLPLLTGLAIALVQSAGSLEPITWNDVAPLGPRLQAAGITEATFTAHITRLREAHARRVRDGDFDHLIFYALQSTRFTTLPRIEPALSAKVLVDTLGTGDRAAFLKTGEAAADHIPAAARARIKEFIRALDSRDREPRLQYFRRLVLSTFPDRAQRDTSLLREYLRVMQFVYEKEFVAQRSERAAEAVVQLYRTRGLSTDTAVEAGYLVSLGLAVVKSLEPDRRIRRVLIVGPGLDLAPRTALLEVGPPESYQPWAIIDALVALNLARPDDLDVVAADINPRVVEHLRRARDNPPTLTLVSEIRDTASVTLTPEYREYFGELGRAVGDVARGTPGMDLADGHLRKTVRIRPAAARALRAEEIDIVTERLDGPAFDLIVATNILPYFDDGELMLAMSNVAGMLAPGGLFLHNEVRPGLPEVAAQVGLPFAQSRQVVIATVRGAPPLVDSVWIHKKPTGF